MSFDKKYQIFISSTYQDLIEERQAVLMGVLKMEHIPAGMELFPAANESAWRHIKNVIDGSDYYVLIIAGRYGSVDNEGMGYTEKEYDYAVSVDKPVIPLLYEHPEKIPVGQTDGSEAAWEKLQKFRQKIKDKHSCDFWSNSDELKSKVILGLTSSIKQCQAVGWIRADKIQSDTVSVNIDDHRDKNTTLDMIQNISKTNVYDRKVLLKLGLEASRSVEKEGIAMWGRFLRKTEGLSRQLNLSAVQFNDTWAQWIYGLLEDTGNPDIDYFNFGNYYFFYEIISGEIIEIPTGTKAKNIKTKETIKPGMILFLMEK